MSFCCVLTWIKIRNSQSWFHGDNSKSVLRIVERYGWIEGILSCHWYSRSSVCYRMLLVLSLETNKNIILTDKQVKAELRLTKEKWSRKLYDKTSDEYEALAAQVKSSVCILELVIR